MPRYHGAGPAWTAAGGRASVAAWTAGGALIGSDREPPKILPGPARASCNERTDRRSSNRHRNIHQTRRTRAAAHASAHLSAGPPCRAGGSQGGPWRVAEEMLPSSRPRTSIVKLSPLSPSSLKQPGGTNSRSKPPSKPPHRSAQHVASFKAQTKEQAGGRPHAAGSVRFSCQRSQTSLHPSLGTCLNRGRADYLRRTGDGQPLLVEFVVSIVTRIQNPGLLV